MEKVKTTTNKPWNRHFIDLNTTLRDDFDEDEIVHFEYKGAGFIVRFRDPEWSREIVSIECESQTLSIDEMDELTEEEEWKKTFEEKVENYEYI